MQKRPNFASDHCSYKLTPPLILRATPFLETAFFLASRKFFSLILFCCFRLLDAEAKKCKELKKEVSNLQKTLENLNQQLESERSEKSCLNAEIESHSSRHASEIAKIKQSCEEKLRNGLDQQAAELNSEWRRRLEEQSLKHNADLRKLEANFKSTLEVCLSHYSPSAIAINVLDVFQAVRVELDAENDLKQKELKRTVAELGAKNESSQKELSIVQAKAGGAFNNMLVV